MFQVLDRSTVLLLTSTQCCLRHQNSVTARHNNNNNNSNNQLSEVPHVARGILEILEKKILILEKIII